MSHLTYRRGLTGVVALLALAALAQPVSAQTGTNATVGCKRLHARHIRCTMTIQDGGGISGTVRMRVKRGTLVVAHGEGRVRRGTATLVMRVVHRMTPGPYRVAMVLTITANRVVVVG